MMRVLRVMLVAAEMVIAGPVLYLFCLSIAAVVGHRRRSGEYARGRSDSGVPGTSFAILLPAHNEEVVLTRLLESLRALDYPKDRYAVYLVADNCTDGTAALARREAGVHVYERFDHARRGKGFALNWLWQRLEEDGFVHDAYIIFDADSVVEPNYLRIMAGELAKGAQALQGRSTILNATESPSTAIRLIGVTLVNDVRHLGRNALGGSSTLANGMCLSRALLQQYPWQAFSLTEDYEYYLTLVQNGVRVRFVPEAVVRTHMPATFAHMRTQDIRWESSSGGPSTRSVALKLLGSGLRARDFLRIDAVAELLTPPLSVLVSCCSLSAVASLLVKSRVGTLFSALLTGGLLTYVGVGLYLLRPPRAIYKAFLYAPGYMLWKVWVFLVLRNRKQQTKEWVRTSRTGAGQ